MRPVVVTRWLNQFPGMLGSGGGLTQLPGTMIAQLHGKTG